MKWVGQAAHVIAKAVQDGQVTATEVVRQHLDHIRDVDPKVGAFVLTRPGEALAEAGRLDDRRDLDTLPLAGVPVAIKDVVDVTGHPTRHGSNATSAALATSDDQTVGRLRAAGAIVVGKTRCPEFSIWGTSDTDEGTARNPWDLARTPGGSSGGSGAAVAAAMTPIALASDGMGSVRIPAACNGLVGIKPGSGVVPMHFGDRDEHWSGMTQYGPLATNVTDMALMLSVLADDPSLGEVAAAPSGLRIGVCASPVLLGTRVSKSWRTSLAMTASALEAAGHTIVKTKAPASTGDVVATSVRWLHGSDDDMTVLGADRSRIQPRTAAHARAGRLAARLRPIRDEQAQAFQAKVAAMFQDIDVLLTPTLLRSPPVAADWRQRGWLANVVANAQYASMTGPWNFGDVPAAAVPVSPGDDGMPRSVQVVGPHGAERVVLSIAAVLEGAAPWQRHAPMVQSAVTAIVA